LVGQAKFQLPEPKVITLKVTLTLTKFAGAVDGEVEAVITIFIHEDFAAAAAMLGHAAYHREDVDEADASPGARHALAHPAAAAEADEKGAARLGDVKTRRGSCEWASSQRLGYLSLHAFECPAGYGMTSWKINGGECGWWHQRAITQCTNDANLLVSGKAVHTPLPMYWGKNNCLETTTSWIKIEANNGDLSNIGKFGEEIQCATDHFMTDWRFDSSEQYGRVRFTCCKSTLPLEPVLRSGRCDVGGGAGDMLEFLDKHSPTCAAGEVMTGWSVVPGCDRNKMQATASCAAIPIAPPPAPAPPPPLPSPPPSPPPPAYLSNGVAVKAFHLSTRVKKPLTIQGISMNSMNLEMDCFKNAEGFYYKAGGVLRTSTLPTSIILLLHLLLRASV
jgi:hypothetical protein